MKRSSAKIIISVFVVMILLSSQAVLPLSASAAALPYDNPNGGNKNPYKMSIASSNADILSAVVGCSGVVNKISKAITGVIAAGTDSAIAAVSNLFSSSSGGETGIEINQSTYKGESYEALAQKQAQALAKVPTDDQNTQAALKTVNGNLAEAQQREECFNGIAYTLAKNELTSMTKATMNWINTGFNGNPLYVQDENEYVQAITDGILKREIQLFGNTTSYPYGGDYTLSLVNAHQIAQDFENSMKSTLLNYLSNGDEVVDAANMFSTGGWDGWLAMTQYPQNNPMGFTMLTDQYISDQQQNAAQNAKAMADRGNGVLDSQKCDSTVNATIQAAATKASQAHTQAETDFENANAAYKAAYYKYVQDVKNNKKDLWSQDQSTTLDLKNKADAAAKALSTAEINDENAQAATTDCTKWKTVTPGSIIKDKISAYVNSPERQLELADTINKSLNAVFYTLLSKFEDQGLPGLATTKTDLVVNPTNFVSSAYGSNTGGFNGIFDITTDLGNIYANNTYNTKGVTNVTNDGNWNASTNSPTLISQKGKTNHYYIVSVAGDALFIDSTADFNKGDTITDINITNQASDRVKSISTSARGNAITITNSDNFNAGDTIRDEVTKATQVIRSISTGTNLDGNATWNECDKVFFDGSHWVKGIPDSILLKEGLIETQEDYLCIAKAAMKVLPYVVPTIGHLDYCIPGPNPNWKLNSQDAQQAYSDWLNGIYVKTVDVSNSIVAKGGTAILSMIPIVNSFTSNVNTGKGETDFPSSAIYQSIFNGTNLFDIIKKEDFFNLIFQHGSLQQDNSNGPEIWITATSETTQATPVAQQDLDDTVQKWTNYIANLNGEYQDKINKLYGPSSPMQTEFNVDADYNVTPNSYYLQMAQTGLNITKDIQTDNDNISASEKDYTDGITQANSNIYILQDMKNQIDAIVNAACQRSDSCKARVAKGLPALPLPNCTNS